MYNIYIYEGKGAIRMIPPKKTKQPQSWGRKEGKYEEDQLE
jgi:hypothetical protein